MVNETDFNNNLPADKLDYDLMNEFAVNGRASLAELAKKYGTSISTISRHVEKLLQNGVMRFSIITNPERLNFQSRAHIMLDVELGKISEICEKLATFSNVHLVLRTFGRFNVIIGVHFTSNKEMGLFIQNDLSSIDGIRQIETHVEAELVKRDWAWIPNYPFSWVP